MMFLRLLPVLAFLTICRATYFIVTPVPRCFTIDQPKGTPIIFTYEVMDEDHSVDIGIYYGTTPADDMRIQTKKVHKR